MIDISRVRERISSVRKTHSVRISVVESFDVIGIDCFKIVDRNES